MIKWIILYNTLCKQGWYKQRNVWKKRQRNNRIWDTIDIDGILWLNEKHIEGSDHKNFREITIKYHSDHRKDRR